jgi:hypothetical protein
MGVRAMFFVLGMLCAAMASGAAEVPGGGPVPPLGEELRAAFNDACALLALGDFDQSRLIPTDDSVVQYLSPYGPVGIRGMARGMPAVALEWIERILADQAPRPPRDGVFLAHQAVRKTVSDLRLDGYDTLTIEYGPPAQRVRISQTRCLMAITIESGEAAGLFATSDSAEMAQRAAGLLSRLVKLSGDPDLAVPVRHDTCVTCGKRLPPATMPAPLPPELTHSPPTHEEMETYMRGRISAATPSWQLLGWWTDGHRFGILGQKIPGAGSSVGSSANPDSNRTWFYRGPKSKDKVRQMAAEYQASTMPAGTGQ